MAASAAVPMPVTHSPKQPTFSLGPLPESPENLLCPLVATPQAAFLEVFCPPRWPVNQRFWPKNSISFKVTYQVMTLKISLRPFHPLRLLWAAKLLQIEWLILPGMDFPRFEIFSTKLGKSQAN